MAAGRRTSALLEASTINFTATGVEFLPPLHLLCTCSNATIKLFKKVRSSDLSTMFDEASLSTLHIHTRKPLIKNPLETCLDNLQPILFVSSLLNHQTSLTGLSIMRTINTDVITIALKSKIAIANRDSGSGNFAKDRWQL